MYKVGLSKWFGDAIVGFLGGTPTLFELILIFSLLALFLSELTSHTAATNMIGPLAITTAMTAGINPIPVAVAIALASSLGFVLPVSTPPNAIFYSSGKIPITKMIKTGIFIDIIGILCITIPLVMFFVTWILGIVSKKSKFINNNLIPVQNILIGVVVAIIEWIITRDFKVAIALSGVLAGGTYDIIHNLDKMIRKR